MAPFLRRVDGIVADGIASPGGLGEGGAAPASEAGLAVAGGGGTFATAGGFGVDTLPGIPGGRGGGELAAPTAAGGLGAGGTIPGMDGGFGGIGDVSG